MCLGWGVEGALCGGGAGTVKLFSGWPGGRLPRVPASAPAEGAGEVQEAAAVAVCPKVAAAAAAAAARADEVAAEEPVTCS